jgi:hypothetical protein
MIFKYINHTYHLLKTNSFKKNKGINHVLSKPHLDFKTEFAETIYNVELTETQPLV